LTTKICFGTLAVETSMLLGVGNKSDGDAVIRMLVGEKYLGYSRNIVLKIDS
jgi:hypothetical protein